MFLVRQSEDARMVSQATHLFVRSNIWRAKLLSIVTNLAANVAEKFSLHEYHHNLYLFKRHYRGIGLDQNEAAKPRL